MSAKNFSFSIKKVIYDLTWLKSALIRCFMFVFLFWTRLVFWNPQILLCPEFFYTVCFTHIIKAKIFLPLQYILPPPNLKTWLWACGKLSLPNRSEWIFYNRQLFDVYETTRWLLQNFCPLYLRQLLAGFPRIFNIHFPYFFNTFLILNLRSSIPSLLLIFRNS